MHAVEFLPSAARELGKLDRRAQARIGRAIDRLASDPRGLGAMKLSGPSNIWRVRVGDYRVLYQIQEEALLVLVVRVGHRRDVYR